MGIPQDDPLHDFLAPTNPATTRSPCPALNALANHRYMFVYLVFYIYLTLDYSSSRPHDGMNISYTDLVDAICSVYNVSRPLAHLLAIVGYSTCGKLSFSIQSSSAIPIPHVTWFINLASLSQHGGFAIAHNASIVHPNVIPSTHSPDPALSEQVLERATSSGGLSLRDLAHIRTERLAKLEQPLSGYHEQVALGEAGLLWSVMREGKQERGYDDVIPVERLRHWLCEERLPDNWWSSVRPSHTVGLIEARSNANAVHTLMTNA